MKWASEKLQHFSTKPCSHTHACHISPILLQFLQIFTKFLANSFANSICLSFNRTAQFHSLKNSNESNTWHFPQRNRTSTNAKHKTGISQRKSMKLTIHALDHHSTQDFSSFVDVNTGFAHSFSVSPIQLTLNVNDQVEQELIIEKHWQKRSGVCSHSFQNQTGSHLCFVWTLVTCAHGLHIDFCHFSHPMMVWGFFWFACQNISRDHFIWHQILKGCFQWTCTESENTNKVSFGFGCSLAKEVDEMDHVGSFFGFVVIFAIDHKWLVQWDSFHHIQCRRLFVNIPKHWNWTCTFPDDVMQLLTHRTKSADCSIAQHPLVVQWLSDNCWPVHTENISHADDWGTSWSILHCGKTSKWVSSRLNRCFVKHLGHVSCTVDVSQEDNWLRLPHWTNDKNWRKRKNAMILGLPQITAGCHTNWEIGWESLFCAGWTISRWIFWQQWEDKLKTWNVETRLLTESMQPVRANVERARHFFHRKS